MNVVTNVKLNRSFSSINKNHFLVKWEKREKLWKTGSIRCNELKMYTFTLVNETECEWRKITTNKGAIWRRK